MMKLRIMSVIAMLTLVTMSSGCSGVRNFLFGRGARCGSMAPKFGNTMQAPCGAPHTQAPCGAPPAQAPCQTPAADCGCNVYSGGAVYGSAYGGCSGGCSGTTSSYGPVVSDPYMSGGTVQGPVVSDTVVGGTTYPQGTIQSDNWSARKFDSDGNRILWEEPLPSGANQL